TLEIARPQLERLRKAEGATAGTRLLDLEEIVRKAESANKEAHERLPYLPEEPYTNSPILKPMPLAAPLPGRLLQLHVSPRQLVMQGDPLWTLSDWSTLWLRVPVFQGDLPSVAPDAPAQVSLPGSP